MNKPITLIARERLPDFAWRDEWRQPDGWPHGQGQFYALQGWSTNQWKISITWAKRDVTLVTVYCLVAPYRFAAEVAAFHIDELLDIVADVLETLQKLRAADERRELQERLRA